MTTPLRKLLSKYRQAALTEREKGTYFEKLAVAFLKHDAVMKDQFEDAWLFSDWATSQGLNAKDTGIDVVAKIRDSEKFCAVQCKFYAEGEKIQKSDIDSFFTASGKSQFARRLIIDTTDAKWSDNAEAAMFDQQITCTRIELSQLEASNIDWEVFIGTNEIKLTEPKKIREHQQQAIEAVRAGLAEGDRGKLIMACGTGKTFTGLKIAEDIAGKGKYVLFLVPSLALMSQTIREWHNDTATPLRSFSVCSDIQVGKRRVSQDDIAEIESLDLEIPATTNPATLASRAKKPAPDKMTVVFSTYQSIQAISDAQIAFDLPEFDLIICDEAHRTTGATISGEDDSNFVKVHDNSFIKSKKRIYMTATPRVYGEAVKSKASEAAAVLYSMDDEALYGKTLFYRGFGWAVEKELLSDYKVLVLAIDDNIVSQSVQKRLAETNNQLKLNDATKIVGCYKALAKIGLEKELLTDPNPMRRALAFCKTIIASKTFKDEFALVVDEYLNSDEGKADLEAYPQINCEIEHVDGTYGAKERGKLLDWIKEPTEDKCRILTNAKCLSEGVDVPALDAIMFMHPRKSKIDIVQSVGRVMRRATNKKMGYVILPIVIQSGMTPEQALDNDESYKVVWDILNALRSHDERLDAKLNQIDLGADVSDQIEIVAISNTLPNKAEPKQKEVGIGQGAAANTDDDEPKEPSIPKEKPKQFELVFDEFSKAIMAKIVKKCGRRDYWENWASDIADIAKAHITRITGIIAKPDTEARKAFDGFLEEIRDDLNESITEADAVEMLAQHIITKPVFDALFEGYSFTENNPVSKAMQSILGILYEHNVEKEAESLEKFYESVKRRAAGIDKAEAKQKIIVELYDKFFRTAFPRMTEKLGIVYTPVEVVDFIIHSVNDVLKSEFGQTLGSEGVHILDPFTGTGTFITRLLQSGLIAPDELERKYKKEIHANEIVLLAYYIAAINIEAVYHTQSGGNYAPFEGICLTDTFQLYEKDDLVSGMMADNSNRRTRQKELDIRVIMGNPPYSIGQGSANDDAQNIQYKSLDDKISKTYIAKSKARGGKRSSYDSYIRAIRWASDRIGTQGVVGFVTNAGFIDAVAADGIRCCLAQEYSSIYIFHLRGNQRTQGEQSRKEGGKIFGSGSRAPISINIFIKNPNAKEQGKIYFHDIGDYLSQQDKLSIISRFKSIDGITKKEAWESIIPNNLYDWRGIRGGAFEEFVLMGGKKGTEKVIFSTFSNGVVSNRDFWVYDPSVTQLKARCITMIDFYNSEIDRYVEYLSSADGNIKSAQEFVSKDVKKISWGGGNWQASFTKGIKELFEPDTIRQAIYRPFSKMWHYGAKRFNHSFYSMLSIFPNSKTENLAIMVKGNWKNDGQIAIMVNALTCLQPDGGAQCFPLYIYDKNEIKNADLFDSENESSSQFVRREAITDAGLEHLQNAYPNEKITKEDVFYYVYGLLHSPEYLEKYADNLSKQLPRIPCVKSKDDFWAFVSAGRELGNLHINYETVEPYAVEIESDPNVATKLSDEQFYRVIKMKHGGKRPNIDKTTVVYNDYITLRNIPIEAYEYVVNGKPAIEWVMERQCVKTDKDSGIVNDANLYAIETMQNPAYPLELLQRVITVSMETIRIVKSLPKLEI